MHWFSALVTFVIVWWMIFFMVLPVGVRGQFETGNVEWGTEPGAPSKDSMGRRMLITTGISVLVWAAIYWLISSGTITLDSIPLWRRPGETPLT